MMIVKRSKKHFNKNFVMSAEDGERFQLSNKCWIWDKVSDVGDDKVRDYCHLTEKYRGSAHWSCNVNLKLTEKVPVIFHNLRGYDSHSVMQEINKFDVKSKKVLVITYNLRGYDSHLFMEEINKFNVELNVISNRLEKYMAFTINNNLVFIDSMQFINSSSNKLIKNLTDNDFRYLSGRFSGNLLELVKQIEVYSYDYVDSFKKFSEDELPNRCKFFSSVKNKQIC